MTVKKALVLSGGSIKGSYQSGVIQSILASKWKPDAVYGVSVGALNGGYLADQIGRQVNQGNNPNWDAAGKDLSNFWRTRITSFKVIGKKRWTFSVLADVLFKDFKSLVKVKRLERLMNEIMHADNIGASPVPFYAGIVDLGTGDLFFADHAQYGSQMVDYIIASTRVPLEMPIKWIDGHPLMDGGLRDIVPMNQAIKDGAQEIYVLSNHPAALPNPTGDENFEWEDLGDFLGRSVDILKHEILRYDLQTCQRVNALVKMSWAHDNKPGKLMDYAIPSGKPKHPYAPLAGKRVVKAKILRPKDPLKIKITKFNSAEINAMVDKGIKDGKAGVGKKWDAS